MKKLIFLVSIALCSVAFADEQPVPEDKPAAGAPRPPSDFRDARECCTYTMNNDPDFAKAIVSTVDKQADKKIIDAEVFAAKRIQMNEAHVIYAYAAMWIVAALFVAFLWRRQQKLMAEIAQLRRDLEDATKDDKDTKK